MRQIKFRSWDEDRRKMHTSPKWVMFRVNKDGVLTAVNYGYSGKEVKLEVMQFTGLTDKNGKDIYESDLLMVKDARICEVIFFTPAGCWDLIPRNILSSQTVGAVCAASYQYHTEVIGNIYEDKHLLEPEK